MVYNGQDNLPAVLIPKESDHEGFIHWRDRHNQFGLFGASFTARDRVVSAKSWEILSASAERSDKF